MADLKISELTNLTAADPANDMIPIVDVSATPPASGSTKRISINNILACSPSATLASATISGDLTVDTSTLKVDSANDRVGVGTTTPSQKLEVATLGSDTRVRINSTSVVCTEYFRSGTGLWLVGSDSTNAFKIARGSNFGGSADYFAIAAATADCTWYDGAGGTRMTLNATGLGVGDVPTANCKLTVRGGAFIDRGAAGGASQLLVSLAASSGGNFGQISNTGTRWALGYGPTLTTVGTEALIWDSSGNVGIGVTPAGTGGCLQLKSGITFPATQVASSDANTLDDYEEGTFTPTVSATAGTLTTTTVNSATYTKIGRLVSVSVDISVVNIGTASGLLLFSLPFNQAADSNVGVLRELGATGQMGQIIYQSATQVAVALYNNGTLIVNGYRFRGTYTYTV